MIKALDVSSEMVQQCASGGGGGGLIMVHGKGIMINIHSYTVDNKCEGSLQHMIKALELSSEMVQQGASDRRAYNGTCREMVQQGASDRRAYNGICSEYNDTE